MRLTNMRINEVAQEFLSTLIGCPNAGNDEKIKEQRGAYPEHAADDVDQTKNDDQSVHIGLLKPELGLKNDNPADVKPLLLKKSMQL